MDAISTVRELRVVGPPGTGKTSFLSRQVALDAERYGADRIMLASLTRAAAAEIAGRDLPIDRAQVGTLHAHCYRALDHPPLTVDHTDEWNAHAREYRVTPGAGASAIDEPDSEHRDGTTGDGLAERYDLLRARMTPRLLWPLSVQSFARVWEGWKHEAGYLDFTDLIETSLEMFPQAPTDPRVLMIDEAQDHSRLEMRLARQWGRHVERLYVVGDPDQAIFGWRGADAAAFEDPPVPDDQRRVLSQSHRLPRAVHAYAVRWIDRMVGRTPVHYQPRDADGSVTKRASATWKHPEPLLRDIEVATANGQTFMVLASCGFMLEPLCAVLRREGIPFHNPYRQTNGRWNPLGRSTAKRISTADRLLAYLRPDPAVWGEYAHEWTARDLRQWTALVRSEGVLARGGRTQIDALTDGDVVPPARLAAWFEDDALVEAWSLSLDWLERAALPAKAKALAFPLTIARRRGAACLRDEPRVIVGTVHSTKGSEADVVAVFPDLSRSGMEQWLRPGEGRDALRRLLYVGMTRARSDLVLCGPASRMAVDL